MPELSVCNSVVGEVFVMKFGRQHRNTFIFQCTEDQQGISESSMYTSVVCTRFVMKFGRQHYIYIHLSISLISARNALRSFSYRLYKLS